MASSEAHQSLNRIIKSEGGWRGWRRHNVWESVGGCEKQKERWRRETGVRWQGRGASEKHAGTLRRFETDSRIAEDTLRCSTQTSLLSSSVPLWLFLPLPLPVRLLPFSSHSHSHKTTNGTGPVPTASSLLEQMFSHGWCLMFICFQFLFKITFCMKCSRCQLDYVHWRFLATKSLCLRSGKDWFWWNDE